MPDDLRHRLVRSMRWAGRVLAVLMTVVSLMFLIGGTVLAVQEEGASGLHLEGVAAGLPVLIGLAACVVLWRWEPVGVVLLLAAYVASALSFFLGNVLAGSGTDFGLLASGWTHPVGLPYLVSGLLLLGSLLLSRGKA